MYLLFGSNKFNILWVAYIAKKGQKSGNLLPLVTIHLEYLLVMMKTRIQSKDNLAMFSFHVETVSQTAWEMKFPTPNWRRICLLFQLENPDRKYWRGSSQFNSSSSLSLTSLQTLWNVMGYTFQRCYFFQKLEWMKRKWPEEGLRCIKRFTICDTKNETKKSRWLSSQKMGNVTSEASCIKNLYFQSFF